MARRAGGGRVLVGRVGVVDHPALGLERDRPLFFGREPVVVGQVFEDVARVGRVERHVVERDHPLDGLLPVFRGRAAVGDARHPHLGVGPVAGAALAIAPARSERDAFVGAASRPARRAAAARPPPSRRRRRHHEPANPFQHGRHHQFCAGVSSLLRRFGNIFSRSSAMWTLAYRTAVSRISEEPSFTIQRENQRGVPQSRSWKKAQINKRLATIVLVAISIAAASGEAPDRNQRPDAILARVDAGDPEAPIEQRTAGVDRREHDLPVVQMSLQVLTGTDADPPGRYGIASLTSAMLTQARLAFCHRHCTGSMPFSPTSPLRAASIPLHFSVRAGPAASRSAAADGRCRATPDVSEGSRTLRQQRLAALRSARDNPDTIAALAFARSIYGPSHRNAAAQIDRRRRHGVDTRGPRSVSPVRISASQQHADRRRGNSAGSVLPLLETHSANGSRRGWMVSSEPAPALRDLLAS